MKDKEQRREILKGLQNCVDEITGDSGIVLTERTKVNEKLGISSLGKIQLLCRVEEHFSVRIPNSSVSRLKRVRDYIDLITELQTL